MESAELEGEAPAGARTWARAHVRLVVGLALALIVAVAAVVAALVVAASSGGQRRIAAGDIVGTQPLSSGYRVTGTVRHHGDASVIVRIARVDTAGGEARNVILRPGADIEFDHPSDGTVAVARNNHLVASALSLHDGDAIVLAGQYTSVVVPPAPPHDGYAYFSIEASPK